MYKILEVEKIYKERFQYMTVCVIPQKFATLAVFTEIEKVYR